MANFKNKTFNLIYVHAALQALVMHAGEGFAFVYLLKAGIDVSVVMLCITLLFGSRILFRLAVVPVAIKFGLRNTLIASVLVEGCSYLLLPQITGLGAMLYGYLFLWAISSSFYWTTYHAYVAQLGNNEHRGAQVSTMEFFGMMMGIVAPLLMGFLLTWFNPWVGFGCVAVAMMLAALPFAFGPHFEVAQNLSVPKNQGRVAVALLFTDGIRSSGTHFVWLIALFLTLNSSFASFGGALALAGFTGAIMGLFAGKWIDKGKGHNAANLGYGAMIISSLVKCFGFAVPWSAVTANALYSAAWPSYATALNSQVYNLARRSPCALRFHVMAEGGWDMGMTFGCGTTALLLYMGFGFFGPLALGVVGCVLGYFVLRRVMASQP